jgi:hypothetical protein
MSTKGDSMQSKVLSATILAGGFAGCGGTGAVRKIAQPKALA